MNKTFTYFLEEEFAKGNPGVLDYDMPDRFNEWLGDIYPQQIVDYAEEFISKIVIVNN